MSQRKTCASCKWYVPEKGWWFFKTPAMCGLSFNVVSGEPTGTCEDNRIYMVIHGCVGCGADGEKWEQRSVNE